MLKKYLAGTGSKFGILAAFVGSLPISFLKWEIFHELLDDFPPFPIYFRFPFGVFYTPWENMLACGLGPVYLIFILLGGALSGYFGERLGLKIFHKRHTDPSSLRWKGGVWWGLLAGLLFDLLFVFVFPIPYD